MSDRRAAKGRTIDGDATRAGRGGGGAEAEAEADRLARKARREGAVGALHRAGDAAARASRDQAIVAGSRAGRSTAEMAKEWKISQREVQRVLKAARSRRSPLDQAPMELVEETFTDYYGQIEAWALLFARALEGENLPVAAAAQKGYADARERLLNRLVEIGKLPEDWETFRLESAIERLGQLVLGALKDAADGKVSIQVAAERVFDLVSRRELPALPPGS